MKKIIIPFLFILLVIVLGCKHEPLMEETKKEVVCFESDVLPVFISNCAKSGCHDAVTHEEGVRTYDYATIMKGIKPNNPSESKYWRVIENGTMPPGRPLSSTQKDLIYTWIKQGANNTTNCDTVCNASSFNYSTTITALLETNCNGCHGGNSPRGGLNFRDYNMLKTTALDGRLIGSVKQESDYAPMPPTGRLSDCQIQQLDNWVKAGAPDN